VEKIYLDTIKNRRILPELLSSSVLFPEKKKSHLPFVEINIQVAIQKQAGIKLMKPSFLG